MSKQTGWQKIIGGLKKIIGGSEKPEPNRPQTRDEIAAELFRRPKTSHPTSPLEPDSPMHRKPGMYNEEEETAANPLTAEQQAAQKRWQKAMPISLAEFWEPMIKNLDTLDYSSMRLVLLEEYPDPSKQALDLFAWYGQGIGRWDNTPQWETVPEQFLMEQPLPTLIQALEDNPLDPAHLEGAARFFSSDLFQAMRGHELPLLPTPIKTALLEHAQETEDAAKIGRVQQIVSDNKQ